METAQSDDAAAEPLVREALARFQSEPARSRAARVLQEMRRTRGGAGLGGPVPGR